MRHVAEQCPSCGAGGLYAFHEQHGVPVHSCRLVATRAEAKAFPTGKLELAVCETCGFITNVAFDVNAQNYFVSYEETQAFSPRFQKFLADLAQAWIAKYDLRGKRLLEIGSGKGEFLILMARLGHNHGTGIDPGFDPGRVDSDTDLEFIKDYYSERYAHLNADAVICRHTLEHIHDVGGLLRLLRRSAVTERSVVLFELPDAMRVLREVAFWDVYYEHVSYFTPGSLARSFRAGGFEVLDVRLDYDDQYILLEGRPAPGASKEQLPLEETVDDVIHAVRGFALGFARHLEKWRTTLLRAREQGERVVLWGAGSKAVAFLTTLGPDNGIDYAVDINPYKHGTFLAGAGQEIVPPEFLREYGPGMIIVMNPIYRDEIGRMLESLGVEARLELV